MAVEGALPRGPTAIANMISQYILIPTCRLITIELGERSIRMRHSRGENAVSIKDCKGRAMSLFLPGKAVMFGREPALDGMRGTAVLAVVCLHLHILRGGHLGVDIFFVLSGFLITSLLLNEIDQTGTFNPATFYYKRAIRLLPPLIITLVLSVIMASFEGSPSSSYADVIASATYTSNYWRGCDRYLWHTWSLSLEAQFYIIWPFIVLALSRKERRTRYIVLSIIILGVLLWRLFVLHGNDEDWAIDRTYSGLDTRCDTLVIGALVAFALRDGFKISNYLIAYICLACSIMAIIAIRPGNYWMHSVGFSFFAAALAYVLAFVVCHRDAVLSSWLAFPPLMYIGNISYGLYLYHFPIMQFLEKDFGSPLIVGALVSLVAAAASWHFIERPLLRRRPARFSAVIEPTR